MDDKKQKIRLDELLVKRGYAESREKAQRLIMARDVIIEGASMVLKPSSRVEGSAMIVLVRSLRYVGRGGEKLEKALENFGIDPTGMVFLDIGASTGGFTDCLLQSGASKVFALDVGYGLLHEKLRRDPRVIPLERVNSRYLTPQDLNEPIQGITIDVSFISLRLLFPVIATLLTEKGICLALIKPQFEAGREKVGRGGIVKDARIHKEVLGETLVSARDHHLRIQGLTFSPIQGGEGNIEFLAYWVKDSDFFDKSEFEDIINEVVDKAHGYFHRDPPLT